MFSPAANCRIAHPQATLSTPGWNSMGTSSSGWPKPITSNMTVAPS